MDLFPLNERLGIGNSRRIKELEYPVFCGTSKFF